MFYDVFAELCKKRGVRPSKAAEKCGINKSNVSSWKNNGYVPRGDALNKIANYFGVSVDYLMGRVNQPDELYLGANDFPEILKLMSGISSVLIFPTDNCSDKVTSHDKWIALETKLKNVTLNGFLSRTQMSNEAGIIQQANLFASYIPMELKNRNASLYECLKYLQSDSKALNALIKNSSRNEKGELVIEKANEKLPNKVEEPDVTYNDFTYALHNETKELTEENKQKLLEMARFFKEQQDKKKKQ